MAQRVRFSGGTGQHIETARLPHPHPAYHHHPQPPLWQWLAGGGTMRWDTYLFAIFPIPASASRFWLTLAV